MKKMNHNKLIELKKDLEKVKLRYAEFKEGNSTDYSHMWPLMEEIIEKHKLLNCDKAIKSEFRNPEYFIYDVERIIKDQE